MNTASLSSSRWDVEHSVHARGFEPHRIQNVRDGTTNRRPAETSTMPSDAPARGDEAAGHVRRARHDRADDRCGCSRALIAPDRHETQSSASASSAESLPAFDDGSSAHARIFDCSRNPFTPPM
jgi:hypothetical protein